MSNTTEQQAFQEIQNMLKDHNITGDKHHALALDILAMVKRVAQENFDAGYEEGRIEGTYGSDDLNLQSRD